MSSGSPMTCTTCRRAGFTAWRDAILPRLDADRTFNGADPERFLRSAYDGLVTGHHILSRGEDGAVDIAHAFKGPGNPGEAGERAPGAALQGRGVLVRI